MSQTLTAPTFPNTPPKFGGQGHPCNVYHESDDGKTKGFSRPCSICTLRPKRDPKSGKRVVNPDCPNAKE